MTTGAARTLPTAALLSLAVALAWQERGSIAAEDWLPYLVVAALLGIAVATSGAAVALRPLPTLAAVALAAFAAWAAVSALWSPAPALARDEALLRMLYLAALVVPAVTLRTAAERTAGVALLVAAAAGTAVATAAHLLLADDVVALYQSGRPYFPITYPNSAAAFFAIGFWPAIALAATAGRGYVLRSGGLAAATACGAATVMYQSKGAVAAFALSTIVFFAVSPLRLRALLPTSLALALAAAAFLPLTEPIRAADAALEDAARRSAAALLVVTAIAAIAAIGYVAVDRRVTLSRTTTRAVAVLVWLALAAAAVAAVVAFLRAVDDPRAYLGERWEELQRSAEDESFTHLTTLGSNRFDFWRVSLEDFEQNPIRGVGSRGFAASYLERGESHETPARAHSVAMDVLGEEGVIGIALLVLVLAPLLIVASARARVSPGGAALLAGAVYWIGHALVEWNWSFPAVGVPFFVLLGVAVAGGAGPLRGALRARWAVGAAVVAVVASAVWLSAKLTDRAVREPANATRDLRWARALDPLSTKPLVAEWQLVQTADAKIDALQRALEREPESFALRYFLGLTYRDGGQIGDARRELLEAKRRAPRVEAVDTALASLGG